MYKYAKDITADLAASGGTLSLVKGASQTGGYGFIPQAILIVASADDTAEEKEVTGNAFSNVESLNIRLKCNQVHPVAFSSIDITNTTTQTIIILGDAN